VTEFAKIHLTTFSKKKVLLISACLVALELQLAVPLKRMGDTLAKL